MKKRGFTMVELIAIIVILSVMLLIVLPSISAIKRNNELRKKEEIFKNIYIATENYVMENYSDYSNLDNIGSTDYVKVLSLINESYLDHNTKNPNTDDYFESSDVVKITRGTDGIFVYSLTKANSIYDIAKSLVYNGDVCNTSKTYSYMGGCYLKGEQNTNYLWYSGFTWRIMGINKDGTVRLISDENITSIPYHNSSLKFKDSHINDWLNNYFLDNIKKSNIIKVSKWCDSGTSNGSRASTTCLGEEYSVKVGTITLDEYNLAGSYIKTAPIYWTSTYEEDENVWYISSIPYSASSFDSLGVRPIINIDPSAIIASGNGSKTWGTITPYILGENATSNVTGKLGNVASSGQYVRFSDKIYRVIGVKNGETKLVLNSFFDTSIQYGNFSFNTNDGIGYILNTDVLNWIAPYSINKDKIVNTNWILGEFASGLHYSYAVSSTKTATAKVGLMNIGEILSTNIYGSDEEKIAWTLNTSEGDVWCISDYGSAWSEYVGERYDIRPVIVIKSTVDIIGGAGTPVNPYEI